MLGVRISREVRGARGEDGGVAPSRTEYAPRLASLASPLSEGAGAANSAEFLDQSSAMRVSFSPWTAWQALSLWVASGVSGCESASVRTFVESVRSQRAHWLDVRRDRCHHRHNRRLRPRAGRDRLVEPHRDRRECVHRRRRVALAAVAAEMVRPQTILEGDEENRRGYSWINVDGRAVDNIF